MFAFRKKGITAEKVKKSQAFEKAKHQAQEYLNDSEKVAQVIEKADKKAKKRRGPAKKIRENLATFFRLIKAYVNGDYREIPWQSAVMILAAIIYFVMPFDLIPDFILGIGFLDDAAIFAWVARSLSSELETFRQWENRVE